MTDTQSMAQMFRDAANYIREHGLLQNGMFSDSVTKQCCTLGAVMNVLDHSLPVSWGPIPAAEWRFVLDKALGELHPDAPKASSAPVLGCLQYNVPLWNDNYATADQAIEVLERAAQLAEEVSA